MRICIGVCTVERPMMLAACLRSLAQQSVEPGWTVQIVVIDNNARPDALQILRCAELRFATCHIHEPRRGISVARNRLLEAALAFQADWIGFIDDDEIAGPNWIRGMLRAAEEYHADVIQGRAIRRFPLDLPLFVRNHQPVQWAEGARLEYASTNNVFFRAHLVRPDGGALRFDPYFSTTKGEDVDFFFRASLFGAVIVSTNRAIVYETVAADRLTFRSQLGHQIARVAALHAIARRHRRWTIIRRPSAQRVVSRLVFGALFLCITPFYLLGGTRAFSDAVLRAAERLVWAAGTIRGAAGWLPHPYRRIAGS